MIYSRNQTSYDVFSKPVTYKQKFLERKNRRKFGPHTISYKNVSLLRRYIRATGKVLPRKNAQVSSKVHRLIVKSIYRARIVRLLPFVWLTTLLAHVLQDSNPRHQVLETCVLPTELRTHFRDSRIRTCDHLIPNQVRYQAALYPVTQGPYNCVTTVKFKPILIVYIYSFSYEELHYISFHSPSPSSEKCQFSC